MTRSTVKTVALSLSGALLFFAFVALGTWQVYRLQWKLDLIARVNARVHAPVQPAPGPARWPAISAKSDEYLHVQAKGVLLADKSVQVQASTNLGPGFWLVTPLKQADNTVILVNRGFVPPASDKPLVETPSGEVTVTGLVRMTEPKGGFLRSNDPAHNRWYSRDVQAIAKAKQLEHVAPYFIDEDAANNRPDIYPVGGLTIVHFHNSHLVYAITWYTLALMVLWAAWVVRKKQGA